MKKTVLIFGLISGAISAAMILATAAIIDSIGFKNAEILGYTSVPGSVPMARARVRARQNCFVVPLPCHYG